MKNPIILILPDNKGMCEAGVKLSPELISDFGNASCEIKIVMNRLIIS